MNTDQKLKETLSNGNFLEVLNSYDSEITAEQFIYKLLAAILDNDNERVQSILKAIENYELIEFEIDCIHLLQGIHYFYQSDYSRSIESYESIDYDFLLETNSEPHWVNLLWKGLFLYITGLIKGNENPEEGIEAFENAILTFNHCKLQYLVLLTHFQKSKYLEVLGDYDEAICTIEKVLEEMNKVRNHNLLSSCYNNLGRFFHAKGEYQVAIDNTIKALDINRQNNYLRGMATCFNNLGMYFYFKGDYNESLRYYQEAINKFQELDNKEGIGVTKMNIGIIYGIMGDYEQTEISLRSSLSILEEIGTKREISKCYSNFGYLYKEKGNLVQAIEYFSLGMKYQTEINDIYSIAISYSDISDCYFLIGETNLSIQAANNSLELRLKLDNKHQISLSFRTLGKLYCKLNDFDGGISYLENSLDYLIKIGNQREIGELRYDLIDAFLQVNQIQKSQEQLELLQNTMNQLNDNYIYQLSFLAEIKIEKRRGVTPRFLFDRLQGVNFNPFNSIIELEILLVRCEIITMMISVEGPSSNLLKILETSIETLKQNAIKNRNFEIQIKLHIIQAKLALLTDNIDQTIAYLETGLDIAETKNLKLLTKSIRIERDKLLLLVEEKIELDKFDFQELEIQELIVSIKEDIINFYNESFEFHYFSAGKTLCGINREDLESMEKEFNLKKSNLTKCSMCSSMILKNFIMKTIEHRLNRYKCLYCSYPIPDETIQMILPSRELDQKHISRKLMMNKTYHFNLSWTCHKNNCDRPNTINLEIHLPI